MQFAGVGMLNFPVVNKSITVEATEVEIELAALTLWCHCSTATVDHLLKL